MKNNPLSLLKSAVVLLGITAFVSNNVEAQQIPLYDQYYINPFIYNPSLAGASGGSNLYLIRRNQFQDLPGAPVTNAATFDTPLIKDKVGIGFSFSNDQLGLTTRNEFLAAVSYRARFSENQSVFFGLSGGVLDNQFDFSKIQAQTPDESTLYAQTARRSSPTANFGVTYQFKKLELGLAVPQLLAQKITYTNVDDARTYYSLNRHYMGTLKYTFTVNAAKEITAFPLVMVRMSETGKAPIEVDYNAVVKWNNVGWAAISYKQSASLGFNLGLMFKNFSLGYVYEVPMGDIKGYSGSGSEILVGYNFGKASSTVADKKEEAKENSKFDLLAQKVESINKKTNDIANRLDTVEAKINRLVFEKADGLKQDVKVGDVYIMKDVNFETESLKLTDRSYDILDELITFLTNNPNVNIEITGHTDDVGPDAFNLKLSQERSKVVYEYLLEGGNVKADRLTYKGVGKAEPIVTGKSERARFKNRRVEFKITKK
jgi:type IX secretion system PorP/SprF family membrane protein